MSLRDQLRARERPSLDYELPVGDVPSARRALAAAEEAYTAALRRSGKGVRAAVDAARSAVEAAEADLASCYAHIRIPAMEPDEYEALMALHPPREGTDDKTYNRATFPKAAFLASAVEMSAAEWEEVLRDNLSWSEREDLYALAVLVNVRLVNAAVPKG